LNPIVEDASLASRRRSISLLFRNILPDLHIDFALADQACFNQSPGLQGTVEGCGGELIVGELAKSPGSFHHDPEKLAPLLRHIFN
jgi:hypothetical protein